MMMKCLSLNQPFAELVVMGKKTIELRKWATKFRGEFLVHASKKAMLEEYEEFGFEPNSLSRGMIIGKAVIYGVKDYENLPESEWENDAKYHLAGEDFISSTKGFMLKDAVKFEKPLPFAGMLNFFTVDYDPVNHIARQVLQTKLELQSSASVTEKKESE